MRGLYDAAMVVLTLLPMAPVLGRYIQGGRSQTALRRNLWIPAVGLSGTTFAFAAARAITGPGAGWFSGWYALAFVPLAVGVLGLVFSLPEPEETEHSGDMGWLLPILLAFFLQGTASLWTSRVLGVVIPMLSMAGTCLVCVLYTRMSKKLLEAARQEEQKHLLEKTMEMQSRQYTALQEQIAAAKEARHDLRHHLSALWSYAERGNQEDLKEYLREWAPQNTDTALTYCANSAVNAVASHYLSQAQNAGVRLDVAMDIEEDTGIPAADLCIILGNALENAVDAALCATGDHRYIRVRAETTEDWLAIVIGNGFDGAAPERTAEGKLLSHKAQGRVGVGTQSIESVAKKYGGVAQYEVEDALFKTSVVLFRQDSK